MPAASSSSNYGRGMTVVLDDKGKKYIRFLTWAQVWTNFTDNNPGTVNAYDELKDSPWISASGVFGFSHIRSSPKNT